MRISLKHIAIVAMLHLAALPLCAQVIYECDFENPTENALWTLNPGNAGGRCPNKWYIGSEGNFTSGGLNGLYISSDQGATCSYTTSSGSAVYCVRELNIPVGSYFLDFDWRALGSSGTSLRVYWMPTTQATNSNPTGGHSTQVDTYEVTTTPLRGSKDWKPQRLSLQVTAATTTGKLVFLWECARDNAAAKLPAACVDNIVITNQVSNCAVPTNLQYNEGNMRLTWTGRATAYDVRDYSTNDNTMIEYDSITGNMLTLALNSEGTHVFYVRAHCGEGQYSTWVSTSTFVWIPGLRCIDYLNIGTSRTQNKGICYTMEHNGSSSGHVFTNSQVSCVGGTGPSDPEAMHVLHTDRNEIDPNTTVGGGLSTIPDGEIASVRLGAYTSSGLDAQIVYDYTVQAGMSDLLDLQYACVLNSGGHSEDNPFFQIEVLDASGHQLEGCTHAYFVADMTGTHDAGWHLESDGDTYWCDWRKVTISLRPYVGQTLKIRLTSSRCVYDTHFGYAYFTLGCRSGGLEGLACGDFSTDHFDAPEGFTYRWYEEGVPNVTVSTERTLDIDPNSSTIYLVECHSTVGNDDCYYTLTANPNPRYPNARFTETHKSENCTNSATFENTSFVSVINREDGSTMGDEEPIYEIVYNYGDGSPEEVVSNIKNTHIFPETGGTFHVLCIASMNDGICQDTAEFDITFPDMIHTGTNDTVHHCVGEQHVLSNGDILTSDTVLTDYLPNMYGCDAPYNHYYFFHPTSYDSTVVELCEGGYVDFEGNRYDQSGRYVVKLQTKYGCDSILELMLTVIPRLEVSMPDTIEICGDDEFLYVPYEILKGRVSAVNVSFDDAAQARGFQANYEFDPQDLIKVPTPRQIYPGYYRMHISLGTPDCPSDPVDVVAKIHYPSSVVDQKNDLVALLNENYNGGGYRWVTYQWYRNGELMPGSTTSYIVVSDADQNAEYVCLLTDEQGNAMTTCPVIYSSASPVDNIVVLTAHPTVLNPGDNIYLSHGGDIRIYDTVGRLVSSARTESSVGAVVKAPELTGVYLVRVGQSAVRVMVK